MGRKPEMSGIFDWIKAKLKPPAPFEAFSGKTGLPAVRPQNLPAVRQEKKKQLSLFDPFLPEPERAEKGLILPPSIRPPALFEAIAPPSLPRRETPEEMKEVYREMFAPSEEAPQAKGLFEAIIPPEMALPEESFDIQSSEREGLHPSEWPLGEPPLWSYTKWKMPSTYQMVARLQSKWDLAGIYEFVLNETGKPYWARLVQDNAHMGEPAVLDIDLISDATDPYSDISRFLNIPEHVIEIYAQSMEGVEKFALEVIQPLSESVGKALDTLRPTLEMRGWFELEPDEDMNFWLRYKEGIPSSHG